MTQEIYTVWCAKGRIGTYHTRERAERVIEEITKHPEKYLHIQEWTPEDYMYPYVTFEDKNET